MKKMKLLAPILGVAASAGVLVPTIVSCNSKSNAESAKVNLNIDWTDVELFEKSTQVDFYKVVTSDKKLQLTTRWFTVDGTKLYADSIYLVINGKVYTQWSDDNPRGYKFKEYFKNGFSIVINPELIPADAKIQLNVKLELANFTGKTVEHLIHHDYICSEYSAQSIIPAAGLDVLSTADVDESGNIIPATLFTGARNESIEFSTKTTGLHGYTGNIYIGFLQYDEGDTTYEYPYLLELSSGTRTPLLGDFYYGQTRLTSYLHSDLSFVTIAPPYADGSWEDDDGNLAPLTGWYTFANSSESRLEIVIALESDFDE